MSAGSGKVKQDISGAGDDHTSNPIWNNDTSPWGKPEAQWYFLPVNAAQNHYRLRNYKYGTYLDSFDCRMVQHSGTVSDDTNWFVYIPQANSGYVQIDKFTSQVDNFPYGKDYTVGITKTSGSSTTDTVTSSIGVEFKGVSASLEYAHQWETSNTVTYSVQSTTHLGPYNMAKGQTLIVKQLQGGYGLFTIQSTEFSVE